eukprot:10604338-Heterocapsa_arctica.AAC.1
MYCGDSSRKGFAFSYSAATPEEMRTLCLYAERWRYQLVDEEEQNSDEQQRPWQPQESMAPSFERW